MNNNTDLITNNLNLIHYVISKINYKNINEYEDLFQTGCICLINASNTYNNKLNIKFSTYAYTCIKNEILKYIKKLPKYNLGLDKEICEDTCLIDLIPDNNVSIENKIIQKEFSFSIRKLLDDLTCDEKIIILMYYNFLDKKYTQKEIFKYTSI